MFRMANIVLYIQENMVNIIFVLSYLFKILNKIIWPNNKCAIYQSVAVSKLYLNVFEFSVYANISLRQCCNQSSYEFLSVDNR